MPVNDAVVIGLDVGTTPVKGAASVPARHADMLPCASTQVLAFVKLRRRLTARMAEWAAAGL